LKYSLKVLKITKIIKKNESSIFVYDT